MILSAEQRLTWQTTYGLTDLQPQPIPAWNSSVLDNTISDDPEDEPIWRWRLIGFEAGEFTAAMTGSSSRVLFCSVPYWSIVLPLTLFSAWQLLSSQRKPDGQNAG